MTTASHLFLLDPHAKGQAGTISRLRRAGRYRILRDIDRCRWPAVRGGRDLSARSQKRMRERKETRASCRPVRAARLPSRANLRYLTRRTTVLHETWCTRARKEVCRRLLRFDKIPSVEPSTVGHRQALLSDIPRSQNFSYRAIDRNTCTPTLVLVCLSARRMALSAGFFRHLCAKVLAQQACPSR
jgi:hypothetical protein